MAAARDFGPAPFFSYVRERAASVAGYVEASMSRDASYDALVLGRSLERVDMTARMLAARLGAGRGSEGWTSTLRACSAHDAYLRTYQQGVEAPRVVEFLLVDRLFPRSVFYALRAGERALARLDPASGRSGLDEPARRAIGRARTDLEFLPAANLLDGLPDRLLGLQRAVSTISEEVTQRLFAGSPPPRGAARNPWHELADRNPAPHRLQVRRTGAGVVQRSEADPAERGRAAHPASYPRGHTRGAAASLCRLLGYEGARIRHPCPAHRARRAGDFDG